MADIPFIDSLQKMHAKMVGWMPTKLLESKIAAGMVIVAEEGPHPDPPPEYRGRGKSLGYCRSLDQYFKHEEYREREFRAEAASADASARAVRAAIGEVAASARAGARAGGKGSEAEEAEGQKWA